MDSMIRLQTTAGTRLYQENTTVYSLLGSGRYLRKTIGDLKPDEVVLWLNQYIDASFEKTKIYPILYERDERYRKAVDTVFVKNSEGDYIPRLRVELFRGAARKGIIGTEDLEKRIMMEDGIDFKSDEYSGVQNWILSGIKELPSEDGVPLRHGSAVRGWLSGKVAAPYQHNQVFYGLATITDSKELLKMWDESESTEPDSFGRNIHIYRKVHQTLPRRLKGNLEKIKERAFRSNGKRKGSSNIINTDLEIEIILDQYLERVNDEFSGSRVISVEKVEPPEGYISESTRKFLSNGAYTGEVRSDMIVLPLIEIIDSWSVLSYVVPCIAERYFEGCLAGFINSSDEFNGALRASRNLFIDNYIKFYTFSKRAAQIAGWVLGFDSQLSDLDVEYQKLKGIGKFASLASEIAGQKIAAEVFSGEIDKYLKIPQNTVLRAFEAYARIENSLPPQFMEWLDSSEKLKMAQFSFQDRAIRRDHDLVKRKLEETLGRRYSWTSGERIFMLLPLLMQRIKELDYVDYKRAVGHGTLFKSEAEYHEIVKMFMNEAWRINNYEYVSQVPTIKTLASDSKIYTSAHTLAILQRHGLEALFKLIPISNFAFEPIHDLEAVLQAEIV